MTNNTAATPASTPVRMPRGLREAPLPRRSRLPGRRPIGRFGLSDDPAGAGLQQHMVMALDRCRIEPHPPRHAEVEDERVAAAGIHQPELGAPRQAGDARTRQPPDQIDGQRPAQVRAARLDARDLGAIQHRAQAAHDRLDLGEFRHLSGRSSRGTGPVRQSLPGECRSLLLGLFLGAAGTLADVLAALVRFDAHAAEPLLSAQVLLPAPVDVHLAALCLRACMEQAPDALYAIARPPSLVSQLTAAWLSEAPSVARAARETREMFRRSRPWNTDDTVLSAL